MQKTPTATAASSTPTRTDLTHRSRIIETHSGKGYLKDTRPRLRRGQVKPCLSGPNDVTEDSDSDLCPANGGHFRRHACLRRYIILAAVDKRRRQTFSGSYARS